MVHAGDPIEHGREHAVLVTECITSTAAEEGLDLDFARLNPADGSQPRGDDGTISSGPGGGFDGDRVVNHGYHYDKRGM